MRLSRALLPLLVLVVALGATPARAEGPDDLVLDVPYRSQLDGTVWASSNCGPTTIGMVLAAYGQDVPTKVLRDRANQLFGIADPSTGTRLQDLARVVAERGLVVNGPYDAARLRRWNLDDVRKEVKAGHPVVPEVYYPLLPNHRAHPVATDHYIAIVGLSGDGFVVNDPADRYGPGYHVVVSAAELTSAWGASEYPFSGFSVGPDSAGRSLQRIRPTPTPTATPTPEPTPEPATPESIGSGAGPAAGPAFETLAEAAPVLTASPEPTAQPTPTPATSPTAIALASAGQANGQDGSPLAWLLAQFRRIIGR
jgi:hypothetical protein